MIPDPVEALECGHTYHVGCIERCIDVQKKGRREICVLKCFSSPIVEQRLAELEASIEHRGGDDDDDGAVADGAVLIVEDQELGEATDLFR